MSLKTTRSMRANQPIRPRTHRFRRWGWGIGLLLSLMVLIAWWGGSGESMRQCSSAVKVGTKGNPLVGLHWQKRTWSGEVLSTKRAGSYTYLRLRTKSGKERWMVVLGKGKERGSQVSTRVYGFRAPFYSRRLNRCFASLHFGRIL